MKDKIDNPSVNPMDYSVATSHEFSKYKIQPAEFMHANSIPYLEGSAIYYILRHKKKNGREDLEKAIHTIQMMLELEYGG